VFCSEDILNKRAIWMLLGKPQTIQIMRYLQYLSIISCDNSYMYLKKNRILIIPLVSPNFSKSIRMNK